MDQCADVRIACCCVTIFVKWRALIGLELYRKVSHLSKDNFLKRVCGINFYFIRQPLHNAIFVNLILFPI
jgi:hypothetical protein